MVRELQRNIDFKEHGVALNCNPDFPSLVNAYGICSKRVTSGDEVESVLQEALESNQPYFLEFVVSDRESTL